MKSRTLNRRAFVRAGALFVPALLLPRKSLGQFASFNDQAFLAQTASGNGLLNGLISYWKFDTGSPIDSVGSNNLTLSVNANSGALAGKINTGAGVGIGSSYIAKTGGFTFGNGVSFTFAGWIFATNFHNSYDSAMLWTQRSAGAVDSLQFIIYLDNNWYWQPMDTSATMLACVVATSASVTDSQWQHVVVGFDAANKQAFSYHNGGNFQTAASTVTGVRASAVDWRIGECSGCGFNAMPGAVHDEIGYWNRVLTATDVANLYNAGAALPLSSFTT